MPNHKHFYLTALMSLFLISILNSAVADEKLYVYKDVNSQENHGIWGNIMPARAAETNSVGFKTFFAPGYGGKGTAVQVAFDLTKPPNWVGLVVPVQRDYWGETEASGLDLSKAKKLIFYAKGEKGGEQIQVKAAIASDKQYGDSALLSIASDWLALEKDWKRYEIPINDGSQLTRVITPFALIANKSYNQGGHISFYVDEIYYELSK
jgi:hypothetical protein